MARMKTKAGTPITKKLVDELAKQAEEGFDLTKARRVHVQPGRPSLEKGVSPRISYRVGKGLYERVK